MDSSSLVRVWRAAYLVAYLALILSTFLLASGLILLNLFRFGFIQHCLNADSFLIT
jgi:hypothetical protein